MRSTTMASIGVIGLTGIMLGIRSGDAQTNDPDQRHVFSMADSVETHSFRTSRTKFLLTAEQSEGRFSIVDETFYPGMNSSPGHRHTFHSEVFYVISGSMEWTVDGKTQVLGPGDLVYIPPNALHYTRVLGEDPVHALMLFEPGGYERGYMARGALTEEDRQDPEAMQRLLQIMDVEPARSE